MKQTFTKWRSNSLHQHYTHSPGPLASPFSPLPPTPPPPPAAAPLPPGAGGVFTAFSGGGDSLVEAVGEAEEETGGKEEERGAEEGGLFSFLNRGASRPLGGSLPFFFNIFFWRGKGTLSHMPVGQQ